MEELPIMSVTDDIFKLIANTHWSLISITLSPAAHNHLTFKHFPSICFIIVMQIIHFDSFYSCILTL